MSKSSVIGGFQKMTRQKPYYDDEDGEHYKKGSKKNKTKRKPRSDYSNMSDTLDEDNLNQYD